MPSPFASLGSAGLKRLDEAIRKAADAGDLPTFVFGATNIEEELYFNGHGSIDYHDPASPPVSPEGIFWICSMTKFIASVATLQLIDRSLLTLDTPVSKFLPQFSNPVVLQYPYKVDKPAFKPLAADTPVTVMHILNHSSGLYYELKGDFPGIPLKFEPGTSWTYGYSCDILGFLIEAITGISFERYCQENIFKPLGMRASFYLTPSLKDDLVRLTFRNPDGTIVPWADQVPIPEHDPEKVFVHLGGVGLYTSMRDYLTLLRHVLRNKDDLQVPGTQILSRTSAESLFQPTLTPRGSEFLDRFEMRNKGLQYSTGLALMGEDIPGMRKKGSGWWGGWAGTTFFLDPTSGIAAVFGTQMVPPGDEMVLKLQQDLERTLYANLEFADVEARPRL